MGCADPSYTQEEHDKYHVGQCPDCDADVDIDGDCVETNHCSYSPVECETCGFRPCDYSC